MKTKTIFSNNTNTKHSANVQNLSLYILLIITIICSIIFALFPPLVLERIVNSYTDISTTDNLNKQYILLGLIYFAFLAASGFFDASREILITKTGQKITHKLRSLLCQKLTKLPASYFTANASGTVASYFVNDVDAIDSLFSNGIISMFVDACKVISIIVVIFIKSKGLGILMLIITPILFLITRIIQKKMFKAQLENRKAISRVNNHVPETISNIRMIHSLHKENYMEKRYDAYIKQSYNAVDKANFYDAIYSPIIVFISACVVSVMMVMSAKGGGYQEFFGISIGTAVAIISYVSKVFNPLESIGMEIQNIQSALAGIKRIRNFLSETERNIPDEDKYLSLYNRENTNNKYSIEFRNVNFSYEDNIPVLKNLSFTVENDTFATLTGKTGAGKSTAFRLLLGLYQPDSGTVYINGIPADLIPDTVKRQLFGYVEQSFKLVQGSVGDQISLFDHNISQEQIEHAAKIVGLHDIISALPDGYDTVATSNMFSQGQFQLLSIARAIVSNPQILLLDEITANLDSETENNVLNAIKRASMNRTVLSISHRLFEKTAMGTIIELS